MQCNICPHACNMYQSLPLQHTLHVAEAPEKRVHKLVSATNPLIAACQPTISQYIIIIYNHMMYAQTKYLGLSKNQVS